MHGRPSFQHALQTLLATCIERSDHLSDTSDRFLLLPAQCRQHCHHMRRRRCHSPDHWAPATTADLDAASVQLHAAAGGGCRLGPQQLRQTCTAKTCTCSPLTMPSIMSIVLLHDASQPALTLVVHSACACAARCPAVLQKLEASEAAVTALRRGACGAVAVITDDGRPQVLRAVQPQLVLAPCTPCATRPQSQRTKVHACSTRSL